VSSAGSSRHSAASRSAERAPTSASAAAPAPPPSLTTPVKILAKASSRASSATSNRASAKAGSGATSKPRPRKTYTVRYELDETGWWLAAVPAIPGCHTQARTLEQAETRIREALALFIPDAAAARAQLVNDVHLPLTCRRALARATAQRAEADRVTRNAHRAIRAAATALSRQGMSLRDTGRLLGVSRQRAHQLLGGAGR
jgi:predicted RNase H-like HicB family nuclease